jgi:hypothetical protein
MKHIEGTIIILIGIVVYLIVSRKEGYRGQGSTVSGGRTNVSGGSTNVSGGSANEEQRWWRTPCPYGKVYMEGRCVDYCPPGYSLTSRGCVQTSIHATTTTESANTPPTVTISRPAWETALLADAPYAAFFISPIIGAIISLVTAILPSAALGQ